MMLDFDSLLRLLPVAITLAGWLLFVVLVFKFRSDDPARSSPRAHEPRFGLQASTGADSVFYNEEDGEMMNDTPTPTVTIRVSGNLFEGHLPYLNQLVQSATDCRLWAVLDLALLVETDSAAVQFLARGEDREFGIASCPPFVRDRIVRERVGDAA